MGLVRRFYKNLYVILVSSPGAFFSGRWLTNPPGSAVLSPSRRPVQRQPCVRAARFAARQQGPGRVLLASSWGIQNWLPRGRDNAVPPLPPLKQWLLMGRSKMMRLVKVPLPLSCEEILAVLFEW